MNINEILEEIKNGESEVLEFKSHMIPIKMLAKIINSMINTNGGKIIIGVGDDGSIIGMNISSPDIKEFNNGRYVIKDINSQNTLYKDYLDIKGAKINNKQILVICIKKKRWSKIVNIDQKVYKRVGAQTVVKTSEKNKLRSIDYSNVIMQTKVPDEPMNPGDEIVVYDSIKIRPHKNVIELKYRFNSGRENFEEAPSVGLSE